MWPPPRASEYKGVGPINSKSHKHQLGKGYLSAVAQEVAQETGSLNPQWVSWLMGFPVDWSDLDVEKIGANDRSQPGDWLPEPENVPRVANNIQNRAARLKQLGNAVVPQIPEMIGRAILAT